MFFIIAGVQPKTRTLDTTPRRCPRCGLHQAFTRQVDHYFSLFFIPLVRVRQGDPFLFCRRCEKPVDAADSSGGGPGAAEGRSPRACSRCGRALQHDFAYCPHCGQRQ